MNRFILSAVLGLFLSSSLYALTINTRYGYMNEEQYKKHKANQDKQAKSDNQSTDAQNADAQNAINAGGTESYTQPAINSDTSDQMTGSQDQPSDQSDQTNKPDNNTVSATENNSNLQPSSSTSSDDVSDTDQ